MCSVLFLGYYKESRSFDTCQLCKRGWFQVKRGQTTCKECPQGFYCPVSEILCCHALNSDGFCYSMGLFLGFVILDSYANLRLRLGFA